MSVCKVCGKEFETSRYRSFCSSRCYHKDWWDKRTLEDRHVCPICGNDFRPGKDFRKYCSHACHEEGVKRNIKASKQRAKLLPGHEPAVLTERVCPICGKTYMPNAHHQRFCSRACYKANENRARREKRAVDLKSKIITKTCAWCGKTFETWRNYKLACCHACGYEWNKHRCSLAEYERRVAAKREAAVAKAAEKIAKVRVNGLTSKQMQDVIDAQDGDLSNLYRLSQNWTPEQRKFAKARYEQMYGL